VRIGDSVDFLIVVLKQWRDSARFESLWRQPANHRLGKSADGIFGGSKDFFDLAALQSRKCAISFQLGVMLGQKFSLASSSSLASRTTIAGPDFVPLDILSEAKP
jgi:hypothetical protein